MKVYQVQFSKKVDKNAQIFGEVVIADDLSFDAALEILKPENAKKIWRINCIADNCYIANQEKKVEMENTATPEYEYKVIAEEEVSEDVE